jgi:transglutaminase-like putative cysteine protease
MYYTIRHITRFRYGSPISESVMEVRMQPRTEGGQRCLDFRLHTSPRAQILGYRDDLGNAVHHFDVPGSHTLLTITAEALVEVTPQPPLPLVLEPAAWTDLDALAATDAHWFELAPSHFAQPTALLREFARELRLERRADPLTTLRALTADVYDSFAYAAQMTHVHSPIDDALRSRQGVCQDFAHIMIALVRELGVPCRYVSGYLFHRHEDHDRSADDATHAWVEALLPGLGWVGFDPTNNIPVLDRHIRVALGRDYADVPPTRGVFKGKTDSTLEVAVRVTPTTEPPSAEGILPAMTWLPPDRAEPDEPAGLAQAQQQQQ